MFILTHTAVLLMPLLALLGMGMGGAWTWALPILIFGIVPLIELFSTGSRSNPDSYEEAKRRSSFIYDGLLYLMVLMQWVSIFVFFHYSGYFSGWEFVGVVLSMGILCGTLGINVAHELGHRPDKLNRFLAKATLLTSLYMHFYIEHNRGHHQRVGTHEDPATGRKGEGVYWFWVRSVFGSWLSAWSLEKKRLSKKGVSIWGLQNEMLRYTLIQISALALVGFVFSLEILIAWILASIFGILLLETVNYLEHYGLERDQTDNGSYEHVHPAHSWNSNHPLSRVLLFDLTRHSDHHANPTRPYPLLRHFNAAPELPTGYPGMILLALLPPAFKYIMARRLKAETKRIALESS